MRPPVRATTSWSRRSWVVASDRRTTALSEPTRLLAHEQAAKLRAGELSSRELTEAHLAVAERQNRALNAWLAIDRERALDEADAADARLAEARAGGAAALEATHPLLGVPIALKDLVSVAGRQCTAGSRILEGYRAPYDAHITERLRDAGAVVLGKTNMDEFAMGSSTEHSAYGPTANPWALDRVPGGSSGGSAAAVAAYHAPLSIGTDTGGSIRQPAALTGIVGLKPTYGRVSRYGIVAFASSLDQVGPFARDVRDAAALLHAIAGRDDRDSTSSPKPVPDTLLRLPASDDEAAGALRGKRLGLPREYFVPGMEPGVEARVREAVAAFEAAGAIVEEVSLPHTEYGLATYYIVAPAEASANLARYDGIRFGPRLGGEDVLSVYLETRGRLFGPEVKRRIMLGTYALSAGYYDAYYLKAQKVRTLIKGDFDSLWAQGFDALVAPTSPTVAFRLGARLADPVAMYLSDACTLPVNMAGLPGISIPCGLSEGLPVGLQLIGAPWSEPELFALARGYEGITADAPWRGMEPAELALADDPDALSPADRRAPPAPAGPARD
jgi:aspartyl-tRNA(Asn)/glutamyl-tRNA(Gln) amidotransferase subunit A